MNLLALLTVSLIGGLLQCCEAAKILAIFPYPGPSQYILVVPYLKELAKRGHEITSINVFPQKEPIANFRDVPIVDVLPVYEEFLRSGDLVGDKWHNLQAVHKFCDFVHDFAFKSPAVQELIHSNETFDLVITEIFNNEPLYGFAQHFNAPLIGVSSFGTDRAIDQLVSNISPVSYLPQNEIGYTEQMTFWQRLHNLYSVTLEHIYMHAIYYPDQERYYKQNFPNAKVSMMELRRSFSLILLNHHVAFGLARPYVPNMIPVGGFHIQHKPAPLPDDMAKFIASYPEGIIYFSLGSNVKSKDLPAPAIQTLLKVFATLKQGVMWKFESLDLPNKPKNVFISKWFPQPDILAHPNVKLFITHGGLLSTIEAIHHAKPIVGIPFFYDQFSNVRRAVESGYGLSIDLATLNAEDFKRSVERVLNEPAFAKRAQELSKLYHDQPVNPMDLAIYWTEYVLRHKGAPHLQVAGHRLNFFQMHSVDTMLVLYGGTLVVLILVLLVFDKGLCKLLRLLRGEKPKQKTQ